MDSRLTQKKKKKNFASNDYFVHFPTYVKICPGMVAISYFGLTNKMQIVYSVVKEHHVTISSNIWFLSRREFEILNGTKIALYFED